MRKATNIAIEATSIALAPIILIACAVFRVSFSAILLICAIALSLAMFLLSWETSKPTLRKVMPVVVLSALAAAGRIIFAPVPSVQPVTAICIISGIVFGRREAFMTGSMAAFVSNCFLGQGMWTLWQMYAWGMVGYLSGVFFFRRGEFDGPISRKGLDVVQKAGNVAGRSRLSKMAVYAFGFVASYFFSFIMNTWAIVGFSEALSIQAVVAIYASGLVFDTAHAVSTVVFLMILYPSWERKLFRIKRKYALGTG